MRRSILAGVLAFLTTALAACSAGPGSSGSAGGPRGTLTISNASGTLWNCSFNPFDPGSLSDGIGPVYEPLMFVDALQNAKATPWLASSYAWSADNRTLTFTIQKNVTFSDGTPMTAADVAFTFNLLKEFPALDLNSTWSVLSSVSQAGDTVVMRFRAVSVPYFYYIADQVPIVPEHIWASIRDPVTYTDSNPVGTGAYTVSPCTPQNITYLANPHYWQHGLPKVAKVLYPAFTSNDPANTYLDTGQAQWGSQFIPNIDAVYSSKSPNNHYWFVPTANVSLIPNLTVPGLDDVAVRQAIAYALDRGRIASVGEYDEEPAANQNGVVTPTFNPWLDTAAQGEYGYGYNPAKAQSLLRQAGYVMGGDGIDAKGGRKLSFTAIDIGGYSDWVASMAVIQSELKDVGIGLSVENLGPNDYLSRLQSGDYQVAYYAQAGGPSPYYEFRQWLYSANSAPIGKNAASDWERYSSAATDELLDSYASTTSTAAQEAIMNQLQQVVLSDVPYIPVTEEVAWFQYNTADFTGWPSQSDPYAVPAVYAYPDMGQVLLHLSPK